VTVDGGQVPSVLDSFRHKVGDRVCSWGERAKHAKQNQGGLIKHLSRATFSRIWRQSNSELYAQGQTGFRIETGVETGGLLKEKQMGGVELNCTHHEEPR
jgi:hypothetical protein